MVALEENVRTSVSGIYHLGTMNVLPKFNGNPFSHSDISVSRKVVDQPTDEHCYP